MGAQSQKQGQDNCSTATHELGQKEAARKPSDRREVGIQGHLVRAQSGGSAQQREEHDEPRVENGQCHLC